MKKLTAFFGIVLLAGVLLWAGSRIRAGTEKLFQLVNEQSVEQDVEQWYLGPHQFLAFGQGKLQRLAAEGTMETMADGSIQSVLFSRSGRFWLTLRLQPARERPRENRQLVITVYRAPGEVQYQLTFPMPYDEAYPALALDDKTGALAVGRAPTAELWIYNGNGQLQQHQTLIEKADYDLERLLHLQWADSAGFLVALVAAHGPQPVSVNGQSGTLSMHPFLVRFHRTGKLLARKDFGECMAGNLAVHPGGNQLLVGIYHMNQQHQLQKYTVLLDSLGKEILQAPLLFKHAAFDAEGKQVILADNRQVLAYDVEQKKQLWEYQVKARNRMITAVQLILPQGKAAVLTAINAYNGNRFFFDVPQLLVLDKEGHVAQTLDFLKEDFLKPSLAVSPDGKTIRIGFRHSVKVFQLK